MLLDFAIAVPPGLKEGSKIAAIAPSGPFDRTLVLRGLGWLGERYRVEFERSLFEREGYLAGSDARRLAELNRFLRDPGVEAVIAVRGGYGLTRIAERADFAALRAHPKWLVGFSDVTALHVEALRAGVASLHAQNIGGLGHGDARLRARFVQALEYPTAPKSYDLERWIPGRACGPLVGGNLALLAATAHRLRFPAGAILVLEDVTEQAYRLDRMLTALISAGTLDGIGGVVLGDFTDCPPSGGVSPATVLHERLATLRVPVAAGLPFGHGRWNEPLTLGIRAQLDGNEGRLTLGEPT